MPVTTDSLDRIIARIQYLWYTSYFPFTNSDMNWLLNSRHVIALKVSSRQVHSIRNPWGIAQLLMGSGWLIYDYLETQSLPSASNPWEWYFYARSNNKSLLTQSSYEWVSMKWGIYLCSKQIMPLITGSKNSHLLKKNYLPLPQWFPEYHYCHLLLINFYSCIDVSDEEVCGIKSNSPREQPKG